MYLFIAKLVQMSRCVSVGHASFQAKRVEWDDVYLCLLHSSCLHHLGNLSSSLRTLLPDSGKLGRFLYWHFVQPSFQSFSPSVRVLVFSITACRTQLGAFAVDNRALLYLNSQILNCSRSHLQRLMKLVYRFEKRSLVHARGHTFVRVTPQSLKYFFKGLWYPDTHLSGKKNLKRSWLQAFRKNDPKHTRD